MGKLYTDEQNAQVVMSLLKQHGIRKVIASPGTTNMALVASMQQDAFFEMYSAVDERSAAYMACGMAAESGEPVVISCTGATASRNYMPGMTEAFYRKLPILAITSTQNVARVGHHVSQVIDRSQIPNDVAKLSLTLPIVKDKDDLWDCEIKVNQAILELKNEGGGPVHLNLQTTYSRNYEVEALPKSRLLNRFDLSDNLPELPTGNIGILVCSHKRWSKKETSAVEQFCEKTGAVVFCDHTSGYSGKNRILSSLLTGQKYIDRSAYCPDLLIHIGEITGDSYSIRAARNKVWRVNRDGIVRDPFKTLEYVFDMSECDFFAYYAENTATRTNDFFSQCKAVDNAIRTKIPEVPFSNVWLAAKISKLIPANSAVHFGILNSLRTWNFYELPTTVESACNVGGFGIDGGLSSILGASLCAPDKIYFGVIGDLAFFYDMNSLGNRHVGKNIRILLINNGKGTEFRQFGHLAESFGENADKFISAAGHFGKQSPTLVKNYVESLGFEYLSASNKEEFENVYEQFLVPGVTERPLLLEVFTNSEDESKALEMMLKIENASMGGAKQAGKGIAKKLIGESGLNIIRKIRK